MQSYEIKEPVTVEINVTGESHRFELAPGVIKPKNEDHERALESLAETNPELCVRVKTATRSTKAKER